VAALSGTGGGEGPAGTALSLVLDSSDSSFGSPVEGGGSSNGGFEVAGLVDVASGDLDSVEDSSELLVGQVSEFVHGQGVSSVLGIVLVNELLVVLEDGISVLEFSMIVRFVVLLHPLNEEVLELSFSSECKGTSEKDSKEKDGLHD
jgi:hypothetical protein